jgi:hypothetical protein
MTREPWRFKPGTPRLFPPYEPRHDPKSLEYGRKRTPFERRRDRERGVDRFGKPLPRVLGTNPRARKELPPAA